MLLKSCFFQNLRTRRLKNLHLLIIKYHCFLRKTPILKRSHLWFFFLQTKHYWRYLRVNLPLRTSPKGSLLLFSWRQGTVLSLKYSQENPHTHTRCQKSRELLAELLLKVICSTESPNRALSLLWSISVPLSPVEGWCERETGSQTDVTPADSHSTDAVNTPQPHSTIEHSTAPIHIPSHQIILTDIILRRKYKYHNITRTVRVL